MTKISVLGVPIGPYKAYLKSVTEKDGEFGPSLFYEFVVVGGKHDGETIGRFTPMPKAGNAGAKFLQGIIGKAVDVDQAVDFDEFIGRAYSVIVGPTKTGSTRVEQCILIAEGAAA